MKGLLLAGGNIFAISEMIDLLELSVNALPTLSRGNIAAIDRKNVMTQEPLARSKLHEDPFQ